VNGASGAENSVTCFLMASAPWAGKGAALAGA